MRLLALCLAGGIAGFVLAKLTAAPDMARRADHTRNAHPTPAKVAVSHVATNTPGSPKSVQDRLEGVLSGNDTLAVAQRMIDWINHSTPEDFAELAKSPSKFPMPILYDFDQEFRSAYFDALAERWLTLDPEGGLNAMKALSDRLAKGDRFDTRTSEADGILKAAARIHPEAVLKNLIGELGKEKRRGVVINEAFTALGARDPKAARGFLDALENPAARPIAEASIAKGIALSDPLTAVAIGKQLKDDNVHYAAVAAAQRIGPGMIRQVASALGEDLVRLRDFPMLALRYPEILDNMGMPAEKKVEAYIGANVAAAADRLTPDECNATLARLKNLPPGMRDAMAATVASSWARTEPKQAAEWAMAQAKPEDRSDPANQASQEVFVRWAYADPGAAVAWLRGLPPSSLRDALGTNASTFIAEQGDLDTALALFRPQPGKEDSQVTAQLVQIFVERDPAKAAEWLRDLPEGASVKDSAGTVVNSWYLRDPTAVAKWVESLPAGPRRDEATQAFVRQAAVESAMGVAEWVETIADPKLRREATEQVYWLMRNEDPEGANRWLNKLQGVDPQWQARFIRMFQ